MDHGTWKQLHSWTRASCWSCREEPSQAEGLTRRQSNAMKRFHYSCCTHESGSCMLALLKYSDSMMQTSNHVLPSFVTVTPASDGYAIGWQRLELAERGSLPRDWTQNDRDDEGFSGLVPFKCPTHFSA